MFSPDMNEMNETFAELRSSVTAIQFVQEGPVLQTSFFCRDNTGLCIVSALFRDTIYQVDPDS